MLDWQRSTVRSAGVDLAVFEATASSTVSDDRPVLVLVHGWPDTHEVWRDVAADLAGDLRVVTYDTRGFGASGRPREVSAYRIETLADDLYAVAAAVNPGGKVHVVAHDWGSIQSWEAMSRPAAADAFASFTTISGPCLDHVGKLLRHNLTHPTPGNLGNSLAQAVSSTYIWFFHLPVLPTAFLTVLGIPRVWRGFLKLMDGTPAEQVITSPTLRRDMISGVRYYRANILRKLAFPTARPTSVPVLELLNRRDFAIQPATFDTTHEYAEKLWRRDSSTGHWLPSTHPGYVADNVRDFLATLDGRHPVPDTLTRARRFGPGRALAGRLAVITGAGSGIGRETAYAMAELGADVILADLDLDAAQETAATCTGLGASAAAYALDVSDTAAFIDFAATATTLHGVPDIVVNNAGIGLSGESLAATDAQIDRIIEVNLRGVITGCREFGAAMVARGTGGHIVNLASAAAFTPQRALGIYAATKAAVLSYSESLRGELADHHIGVSAICPGIVDTPIVANTPIAGLDDTAQADEQRRLTNLYRRRGYGPAKVAHRIVAAVLADKAVVPVTPEAQISYRVYRFAPWISRFGARRKVVASADPRPADRPAAAGTPSTSLPRTRRRS